MELKTKYKRIYFTDVSDQFSKRKTKTYHCFNNNDAELHDELKQHLGTVKWYSPWRRYCFFPEHDQWTLLVFSGGCSIDVGHFCNQLNEQRKHERAVAKRRIIKHQHRTPNQLHTAE